jgi:hypothetical protein
MKPQRVVRMPPAGIVLSLLLAACANSVSHQDGVGHSTNAGTAPVVQGQGQGQSFLSDNGNISVEFGLTKDKSSDVNPH